MSNATGRVVIAICVLAAFAMPNAAGQASAGDALRIAYGQDYTGRVKLAEEIARVCAPYGVKLMPGANVRTMGSKENAEAVVQGNAQLALCQQDFDIKPYPALRAIAEFRGEYMQFYVSREVRDNAIAHHSGNLFEELRSPTRRRRAGRPDNRYTLETGAVGSGSKSTSKYGGLLKSFGLVPFPEPGWTYYSDNQSYEAIINGSGATDDGYTFVSTPSSDVGTSLYNRGYSLVSFDAQQMEMLKEKNPLWFDGAIPSRRVHDLQSEEIHTPEIHLVLAAGPAVSAEQQDRISDALRSTDFRADPYRLVAVYRSDGSVAGAAGQRSGAIEGSAGGIKVAWWVLACVGLVVLFCLFLVWRAIGVMRRLDPKKR